MRQETSDRSSPGRGFAAPAVAALVVALALLGAGPARAKNDFQNGFEDQLGRIAAHGAVDLGLQVLAGGAYYGPPAVRYYPPSYGYVRPYPVRHVVTHRYVHNHRHGWHCGHGHDRGHGYHRGHDDGWRGRGHGRSW